MKIIVPVIVALFLIGVISIFIYKDEERIISSTSNVQSMMTQYTNEYRSQSGLNDLAENEKLNKSAQVKADILCSTGEWSHNAGGKPFYIDIDNQSYIYKESGENLSRGYQESKDALEAFIDSPSHLENIIGDYEEIGVGYTECNGKHFYAVHYAK